MPLKITLAKSILFIFVCGLSYMLLRSGTAQHEPDFFIPRYNVSEYSSRGPVERTILLDISTNRSIFSEQTVVTAAVRLPFDFQGTLYYKWILGQNLVISKGNLVSEIEVDLKKLQSQEIEIFVQGFDPTVLRHVGFEVWAEKNGRHLYAEGLVSSQKENSFEDVVKNVERLKKERARKSE